MAHPVVHFEIAGPDGKGLVEFYRDLFGWDIKESGPDYWLVAPPDGGIGGGVMQTRDEMPSYLTVYASTDDLEGSLRRVGELGGETVVPPTEIPDVGFFAMFRDPGGNVIGLFRE
ncbi:VOC family protein [Nocardioides sp. NPDC057577]|uniref:VOC family protein n=1 Tax=unclassified Nocardioides TaxID=2615069 RepID=UPI0036639BAF